jgi:hypothetical protein
MRAATSTFPAIHVDGKLKTILKWNSVHAIYICYGYHREKSDAGWKLNHWLIAVRLQDIQTISGWTTHRLRWAGKLKLNCQLFLAVQVQALWK